MEKKKGFFKRLFNGTGTALFTVFVWEIVEELLENLIAFCISSAFAFFVTKALSTLGIMLATQGLKLAIKRFIYPFVLQLTYKEGNDKMKWLKNYWTLAWGNKITGTFAGVGFACVSYFQTFWAFASLNLWFAILVFVLFYNLAIFLGGETLTQILARIQESTKNKELKASLKKVQQAQAIVDKYEEAKKIIAETPKQN